MQGKDGKNLHAGSASAVFAADWDQDGDLDLIVGNIKGEVSWIPNRSGNKTMAFGSPLRIEADGQPILVAKDAGPCVADWDVDGHLDLLVGDDEGKVSFFRNTATTGLPQLAAGLVLVPKSAQGLWVLVEEDRGIRSKVSVADWDEDGRLDLLLGDVIAVKGKEPKLTAAQKAEQDAARATVEEIQKKMAVYRDEALQKFLQEHGVQKMEELSPQQLKNFMKSFRQLEEKDEAQLRLRKELKVPMEISTKHRQKVSTHGHVWVFLRKAAGAAVMEAGAQQSAQ